MRLFEPPTWVRCDVSLQLTDIVVRYGAMDACSGISIDVPAGSVTCVVGANGAGKSTLLRACAGLVPMQGGSVSLDGLDLHDLPASDRVRMGLAFVPEGRATIPELTIDENLQLGGLTQSRTRSRHRAAELLDLFPALAARRSHRADVLSGGERQQLAIARALMSEPRALLLDEPSLGLAPMIVSQILQLVGDLARATSLRILLVEQNAAKALEMADHAYVLALGKVVAEGPARTIAEDSRLLHAYLGSA